MGTPQPGTYTRDGVTRVVTSPAAAVNLTRDGWVATEEDAPKGTSEAPKPKPKSTEN